MSPQRAEPMDCNKSVTRQPVPAVTTESMDQRARAALESWRGAESQLAAISRERPRLGILLVKVVRFRPGRAAAQDVPFTQLLSCGALKI
jgi:hypothetical protein